jgi:pimeloyl-ACP methyl ester carboxylesterase
MFSEEPVYIESRGCRLFGIFHPAVDGTRDLGILFANSGMQNRVGPHRLYVDFARMLCRSGFSVLRIDLPGIGESEGTITETHFDAHNPDDVAGVIDFLKQTKKIKRIALFGICGGARTVLKAGSVDPRVDGLVLWSLPIISIAPSMTSPKEDPRGRMSRKGGILTLKDRMHKATSIEAWKKYFAKGGSVKSIFHDLRGIFWNLVSNEEKWSQERHGEFFAAFSSVIRSGKPALFLYGEKDNVLIEEFKMKINEFPANIRRSCDFSVIRNGNHTFTAMDTQGEAISETIAWLARWSNGNHRPEKIAGRP